MEPALSEFKAKNLMLPEPVSRVSFQDLEIKPSYFFQVRKMIWSRYIYVGDKLWDGQQNEDENRNTEENSNSSRDQRKKSRSKKKKEQQKVRTAQERIHIAP